MFRLFHWNNWLSRFKLWVVYGFIGFIIAITVAVFGIITYTSDSSKDNSRRIFESSLWNALQFQVQTYRFLNYLIALDESDYPLNGKAFFEYDLLMSRVDLLRQSDVGYLIRTFENGRTTRLLNIINGELELLSFNLSKLESGDTSYLPDLIARIQKVEEQINEFVTLVNKGSNEYITSQHKELQRNIDNIQLLSMALLACLLCFCFFIIKGLAEFRRVSRENDHLALGINTVNEDKADLLAFVNQEIRTPINAILSTANTLKSNPSNANTETEALSKHIEESGYQLLHTLETFADLSLIDAKKLSLIPTTQHLQTEIESYLMLFESQMARKNLQVIVYLDPLLPTHVSLDFKRAKEIIIALLQNAITHTPSGSISIQVRPSALTPPQDSFSSNAKTMKMLQVAIRDTGIGMPIELQQDLRVNPSLPMQQDGPLPSKVGLSLALCHKLVYLMKGEMHFSCTPQKGCEFWVDLPYYVTKSTAKKSHPSYQCPDKTHALIIETDPHLAKILSLQLAALNMEVSISKEGSLQENKEYDLIMLGHTPRFEREGHDALQQWKTRSCPVLSYQPQALNNTEYKLTPVHFPITQSQLASIIERIFTKHSTPKVSTDD